MKKTGSPIRVTEAWNNRQAVMDKCKEEEACVGEFIACVNTVKIII